MGSGIFAKLIKGVPKSALADQFQCSSWCQGQYFHLMIRLQLQEAEMKNQVQYLFGPFFHFVINDISELVVENLSIWGIKTNTQQTL